MVELILDVFAFASVVQRDEGLEELKLRKLNNNEIQIFFFRLLKFSQETNKVYLYNWFVILLI